MVLWHAGAVDPDMLDFVSVGRVEELLDRLELLTVRVGLIRLHPAVRDGQSRVTAGALHNLGVVERHLDERTRVLVSYFLEEGQVLAWEGTNEIGVEHEKRAVVCLAWRADCWAARIKFGAAAAHSLTSTGGHHCRCRCRCVRCPAERVPVPVREMSAESRALPRGRFVKRIFLFRRPARNSFPGGGGHADCGDASGPLAGPRCRLR